MTIHIQAVDRGLPQRTGRATVQVNILDVNDNAPVIRGPLTFEVPEKMSVNTVVGRLLAEDRDAGEMKGGQILVSRLG